MSSKLISNCEHCTASWENFKLLTKTELDLVNENRYEAAFKTGEIIIKQGSPAAHVFFIATGMAKVYIEGTNGKNCMLGIALPGELIMSPGAYLNSRHSFSVASLTPARGCFLSVSILRDVVRNNGSFAEAMLKDMSDRYDKTNLRMVNQAQKRMSGRLADILLYLADKVYQSDEYEMILSRQELGELSTMAKECVVRILKEFEDTGIIKSDSSRLKILNREKLELISEKG